MRLRGFVCVRLWYLMMVLTVFIVTKHYDYLFISRGPFRDLSFVFNLIFLVKDLFK